MRAKFLWSGTMTLIIKNVREEFLPAFKGLAEGINAKLETQNAESSLDSAENAKIAESSVNFAESSAESNECPICKEYNYEPSDELLEAIAEFERGEAVHCKDFEEYLVKINE